MGRRRARRFRGARLVAGVMATGGEAWAEAPVPPGAPAVPAASAFVRAERVREPVVVDGKADDLVWRRAPRAGGFVERVPVYGRPAREPTVIQVAYDDEALFVLVRAGTRVQPVARTLRRDDEAIRDDDGVVLRIEPNRAQGAAFLFAVNASEAKYDAIVDDDGRSVVPQWDGVWEARVGRAAGEYVVEYRIPFSILGVQASTVRRMGFSVSRTTVTPSTESDLQLADPPQKADAPSTYGTLGGLSGIRTQRALEIVPYVVARTDFTRDFAVDPRDRPNLSAGVDARVQTGPGSYAELSLLTDFSHVAIDQVEVQSDRFPLFFPEQRPFFINGLNELRFGQPKYRQLVDTRRIGLDGDKVVPILAAGKAYGHTGSLSYSLLAVQTLPRLADERVPTDPGSPADTVAVARLRHTLGRRGFVGVIGATRQRVAPGDHLALGVDGELRSEDGKFSLYGFATGVMTEEPAVAGALDPTTGELAGGEPERTARGESAYARLQYAGRVVRTYADWSLSSHDFDPALGYYSRLSAAEHYATLRVVPRLNSWGIEQVQLGGVASGTFSQDYSRALKDNVTALMTVRMETGQIAEASASYAIDHVDDDFRLFGYEVAAGVYRGPVLALSLTTPIRRSLDASLNYSYLRVFGGYRHDLTEGLALQPSRYFQANVSYRYLDGRLDDASERFAFGVMNGGFVLSATPTLSLDLLARLTLEPNKQRFGSQARLRYQYLPGSDLYLVYRRDAPIAGNAVSGFQEVTLKLSYYFDQALGF